MKITICDGCGRGIRDKIKILSYVLMKQDLDNNTWDTIEDMDFCNDCLEASKTTLPADMKSENEPED